eukprot:10117196-Alexandrium_andersonii.AAC.1
MNPDKYLASGLPPVALRSGGGVAVLAIKFQTFGVRSERRADVCRPTPWHGSVEGSPREAGVRGRR